MPGTHRIGLEPVGKMLLQSMDFNGADTLFNNSHAGLWKELEETLSNMPLHLKASDQSGKQGSFIFDPVGTNEAIKSSLASKGWVGNVPLPNDFRFLGTDVDFVKNDLLVEAQFSNYPFLLNNIVRSELLYKAQHGMPAQKIKVAIIITKAHMFPASNSTLYYEQAVNQVRELARNSVFDIPVRLVGLFSNIGQADAVYTEYSAARYSRTVNNRAVIRLDIQPGKTARSRTKLVQI